MRRLVAALAASLVGVVGFPAPASAVSVSAYESRVVRHLNEQPGVDLVRSRCLDTFALRAAERLHRDFPIRHLNLGPMMDRCGVYDAGECIALLGVSPRRMVQAWMRSPEHRPVIQRQRYHRIGIGAVRHYGKWLVVIRLADRSN